MGAALAAVQVVGRMCTAAPWGIAPADWGALLTMITALGTALTALIYAHIHRSGGPK